MVYRDLVLIARQHLQEIIPADKVDGVAKSIAVDFCQKNVGRLVRVPNLSRIEKAIRDEMIREQFIDMTVEQIAKMHSLDERTVWRIVAPEKDNSQ